MTSTKVLFEIPADIQRGLLSGEYVRIGGVIRHADGKKIVAHLREIGEVSQQLNQHPALAIANLALGVINLGATIAYGEATQRRLGLISEQMTSLQWAVDSGFKRVLAGIDRLEQQRHLDLLVDLRVCAEALSSSQRLEPGSMQRVTRLENARERLTVASTKLVLEAEKQSGPSKSLLGNLVSAAPLDPSSFKGHPWGPIWEQVQQQAHRPQEEFTAASVERIVSVRQAALGCALQAQLIAETDGVDAARELLSRSVERLSFMETTLGSALTEDWGLSALGPRPRFTAAQTDRWLRRYRSTTLVEAIDQAPADVRKAAAARLRWSDEDTRQVVCHPKLDEFVLQFETLHEELDCLRGHCLEFGYAAERGLTIQQYRELMCIEAPEAVGQLVLLQVE